MMDWLTGEHAGNKLGGEAYNWILWNRNKYGGFAGNRFDSRQAACKAVRAIYDAGASMVRVAGIHDEPYRIKEEGGPYADVLVVYVKDPVKERFVIETIKRLEPDEFNRIGKGVFRVWWD